MEKALLEQKLSYLDGCKAVILKGPLNILLLAMPIAFLSYGLQWPDAVTFAFSLISIAPLAERLGFVTEQLAIHTNDTLGGLLNATFGNATELIVAISALFRGLFRLVQLSLLGSILSNLLLVLGSSFFLGGLKHKTQKFSIISSQINSTLLMASVMAIIFPTVLTYAMEETHKHELGFSRATSVVLFLLYFAFIYFQLFTHKDAYDAKVEPACTKSDEIEVGIELAKSPGCCSRISESCDSDPLDLNSGNRIDPSKRLLPDDSQKNNEHVMVIGDTPLTQTSEQMHCEHVEDDVDDEDDEVLSFWFAIFWLTIVTVLIAVLSDALVATIQETAKKCHISGVFISTIIIPIVGNAAEHSSAIVFGIRNKLDISLGIAIGSSTQIAVMVIPLLVIIGWCANLEMSLNFHLYEAFSVFLTVMLVTFAIKDGTSNWLVGAILMGAYLVISFGFYAQTSEDLGDE